MKNIPGFEKYYLTEDGKVYSTHVNRFLNNQINTNGYEFVRLNLNKQQHSFLIHRLLAFVYLNLPDLYSDLEVDHIDSNKSNNKLDNLQVLTVEKHKEKTYGKHWNPNRFCKICNKKLSEYNTSGKCKTCINKEKLNDGITEKLIRYWVTNYSWSRASRELGLSDNGLRKRFTKLTGLTPKEIFSPRPEQVNRPDC